MFILPLLRSPLVVLAGTLVLGLPAVCQSSRALRGGVHWLENRGQWDREFAYGRWAGETWVGITKGAIVLQAIGQADSERITLRFEGASPQVVVEGLGIEPGVHHRYHGTNPDAWIRNVHSFERVRMKGLYEGIDLVVGADAGRLQWDVLLAQEGELAKLRLVVTGGRLLEEPDGRVSLVTTHGSLSAPEVSLSLVEQGERGSIPVRYRLDQETVSFEPAARLAIPMQAPKPPSTTLSAGGPELLWSTYWGAFPSVVQNSDFAESIAYDPLGNVTVTGTVSGIDYLVTPNAVQSPELYDDVFVARFRQDSGELIYSARIGSSTTDRGQEVAVNASGRATVIGWVGQGAQGFPTTQNAFDPVKSQFNQAAFVLRLSPLGDDLEYSTYLEGTNGATMGYALTLAASGSAVVVGTTTSTDFPTTPGALSSTAMGSSDTFITRLDPSGSSLEFSTLIGGVNADNPTAVELDSGESLYVGGVTASVDFPVTPGVYQTQLNMVLGKSYQDLYVSKLTSDGAALQWSTLLGGTDREDAWGLDLLENGDVVIVGATRSTDYPVTPGALQETPSLERDGFVTRLEATGSSLVFSSYLAGLDDDAALAISGDASGLLTIAGYASTAFPITPGAFQTSGNRDAFVTVLHPNGSRAFYSSYLGGTWSDEAHGLAVSPEGLVTVGGRVIGVISPPGGGFPTTPNAIFPSPIGGQSDSFITTLYPLLQGVKLSGTSSPSCLGSVHANATTMPLAGQPFGLYCTQAPPDMDGYLITFSGEVMPTIKPVKSGPEGFLETDLGSLPNTPGKVLRYRYAFRNTPTCPGQGAFSFSNLVVVKVQ